MSNPQFPNLLSPFKLGPYELRNRLVSTAHTTGLPEGGNPTGRYLRYNALKARGGCGLIITFGSAGVHPTSAGSDWGEVDLFDDAVIPHLQNMADAVHEHGTRIVSQITHRGRRGKIGKSRHPLLAPSAVPERHHRQMPHEMEIEEIRMVLDAYGEAALRVKRGRFDGVEILIGYSHLPEQFLSPDSNTRTDEYGGSPENRLRFALEVIDTVREAVGSDFVVGLRVGGDEEADGVLSRPEYLEIIKKLATTGKVDYINVVGTSSENAMSMTQAVPYMWYSSGFWLDWAAEVKRNVDVPVIAVGRIVDPMQAEWVLAEGMADLVAMTRAQIADPEIGTKIAEGRLDDVRPCIGNNQGCSGRLAEGAIGCIYNPVIGREDELSEVVPAESPGKVVVVGGGPAGLEAARVAALRGHKVVLFERRARVGGQIVPYSSAPGREDFAAIFDWLESQVRKLGVDVRVGIDADEDTVMAEAPDAVVVATGSHPLPPSVPGAETGPVVHGEDVLVQETDWGGNVMIMDQEAYHQAPAVAELLASQGRDVEIVSDLFTIGEDIGREKPLVYKRLLGSGVVLTPNTSVTEIREESVSLKNIYTEEERTVDGVTAFVYVGHRAADDFLYKALKGKVDRLHLVGDAMAPRTIHDAIVEGTRAARRI